MRRSLIPAFLLLLAPLTAVTLSDGVAHAAPSSLGTGQQPAVAVGDGGTAQVVWNGLEAVNRSLMVCTLPRGASECSAKRVLPAPGDTVSRPFVMVSGAIVHVFSARFGGDVPGFRGIYRFTSTDGGNSFGPPVLVGTLEFHDAVAGPGDGVSFATHANGSGLFYQRVPTTGAGQTVASANLSTGRLYGGSVGLVSPQVPLVVSGDGAGALASRQYDGSGDVNDASNWLPEVPLGQGDAFSRMASSPSGLFVLTGSDGLQVRRHLGTNFGPPVPIPGSSASPSRDFVHDGAGLMVAAWAQLGGAGHSLEIATTTDGSSFNRARVVSVPEDIAGLRLAIADDHRGVGVWDTGPGSGASRTVRVAAIDANVPPPVPTPSTAPPETVLLAAPEQGSTVGGPPTFEFTSDVAGATFECSLKPAQLDDQQGPSWTPCTSPYTPPGRGFGFLRFRVRAAAGGLVDPTPATVEYFNDPAPYGNMRIRGIDVFQVVQPLSGAKMFGADGSPFTNYCGAGTPTAWVPRPVDIGGATWTRCTPIGDEQRVKYQGVTLDTGKPATAFVYVDMEGAAAVDPKQPLDVILRGTHPNGRQIGPVLVSRITNPAVSRTPWVTLRERVGMYKPQRTAVEFQLPQAWLSTIPVDLHATVQFAAGTRSWNEAECAGDTCADDNEFTLVGVPKASTPAVILAPLMLRTADTEVVPKTFPFPETTFATARHLLPGGERMRIGFFRGAIDVGAVTTMTAVAEPDGEFMCNGMTDLKGPQAQAQRTCRETAAGALMAAWAVENPAREQDGAKVRRVYDVLVGVGDVPLGDGSSTWPGAAWGTDISAVTGAADSPYAMLVVPSSNRPLTSITHELGHIFTAPHAGSTCAGGGGESWPDDDQGRLQGIGFDRRAVLGARIFHDDVIAQYFDLMSYCASNGDRGAAISAAERAGSWLSPRNWNRMLAAVTGFRNRVGARVATSASAGAGTYAAGSVVGGSGVIVRVGQAARAVVTDPASPYRLRSLAADGTLLLETGAPVSASSDSEGGTFVGPVASGARSVELVRDGVVLSTLAASAPPTVRLKSPKAGSRVREKGDLVVRWRSQDADGTPLQASVLYSPDGKTWRTVQAGADTGRAEIPGDWLPGSGKARIRVVVTDGFSRAQDTSGRIRVDGRRPDVRIVAPASGERLLAGQKVRLVAEALDPWGALLPKKSVTWFVGSRQVGRGMTLRAKLPAGKVSLRAVATDQAGRMRSDTMKVRVLPNKIRLLRLDAPPQVKKSARTVKVKTEASGPGTLVVQGRSHRVGAATRTLRVDLLPKSRRGVIRIKVTLVGRGGMTGRVKGFIEVKRR